MTDHPTVLSVQVPRERGGRHVERYYRIEVDGDSDKLIKAALDALLADRMGHLLTRPKAKFGRQK